jgi:hypothetical protein
MAAPTSDSSADPSSPTTAAGLRCVGLCLAAEVTGHTREDALYALSYARSIVENFWDAGSRGEGAAPSEAEERLMTPALH